MVICRLGASFRTSFSANLMSKRPPGLRELNTTISIQDSQPRLTFLNGSPCKSKSEEEPLASTIIDFVCDTSVFGVGKPRVVGIFPPYDEENACAFAVEWRTQVCAQTTSSRRVLIIYILSWHVRRTKGAPGGLSRSLEYCASSFNS